jgi:transposase
MAAFIKDALKDLADEIIAADPTANALIARSEHSTDETDARRLGTIYRAKGIKRVEIPDEPYRTLRSLLSHDLALVGSMTRVRNRLKGLLRRHAIPTAGVSVYRVEGRKAILAKLPNAHLRWQLESQYRLLDQLRAERVAAHRQAARAAINGTNALAERYLARMALGWEDRAAIRDIARKILFIACAMMRTGRPYDETKVKTPTVPRTPRRQKPRTRKAR